jgi:MinD-like ATPase involved in chromosome partitioning or flagellar assembly
MGTIQEDSAVREATIRQQPYSELFPSSRATLDVAQIAKKIDDRSQERSARGGMQFFFRSIVESIG